MIKTRTEATLALNFSRRDEQTILRVYKQEPPLKVVRAFSVDASSSSLALVHLQNVSGGVLGGDQLCLEATVEENAQVQLTTTGSTRVYRQRAGYPITTQTTRIAVEAGGLLEYVPDTLIPYAESQYRQSTTIELMDDAGLFYWEVVTPGREAKGEIFDYALLQIELDIVANGQPIAVERSRIEPAKLAAEGMRLGSPVRLGPYRYFASFYICRVGVEKQEWLDLEARLDEEARAISARGESVWGVSTLPAHGLAVRAVGNSAFAIQQALPRFWQLAKMALYKQDAVMPRKIY